MARHYFSSFHVLHWKQLSVVPVGGARAGGGQIFLVRGCVVTGAWAAGGEAKGAESRDRGLQWKCWSKEEEGKVAPSSLTTPMREVKKRRGSRKSRDEYVRGVSFYDRNPLIEILRRNISNIFAEINFCKTFILRVEVVRFSWWSILLLGLFVVIRTNMYVVSRFRIIFIRFWRRNYVYIYREFIL